MRRPFPLRGRARVLAPLAAGVTSISLIAAGCGGSDTSTGSTASSVAGFVPASAPLYMDVSTEVDGAQWKQIDALGALFPAYPQLKVEMEKEINSGSTRFDADVKPLLGGRAAMAVLKFPEGTQAKDAASDPVKAAEGGEFVAIIDLLDGKDADAEALLKKEADGAPTQVDGVNIYKQSGSGDSYAAVVDGAVLMSDTEANLKTVIDAHRAGGSSVLTGSDRFTEALSKLPGDTFAQFYMDIGTVAKQQAAQASQLGATSLANIEDARMAGSVTAEPEGVRIKGVMMGSPDTAKEFNPTLDEKVPSDAVFFADVSDLDSQVTDAVTKVMAELTDEQRSQAQAFVGQVEPMLGVSLDDIRSLVRDETAVIATKGAPAPGIVVASKVGDGTKAQATLDALRERSPLLLQSLMGSSGKMPAWTPVNLEGGVKGWNLPLSPTGGVTYGVEGSLAMLGSTPAAIRAVQRPSQPLSQLDEYTKAIADAPDKVTGLMWLNVSEAVRLGEAAGAFKSDPEALANLRPVKSVVGWGTGGDEPTFEIFTHVAK